MAPATIREKRGRPDPLRRLVRAIGRRVLGTVTHVATGEAAAALTFDDGPHPAYTPRLLDILARHGARATFFVIGERVAAHPELARRAVAEGHALANHTWSHAQLPDVPGAERRRELARCAATIDPLGGERLFRPPRGRQSLASRLDVARSGHAVVTWSAHAEDWRRHDAAWLAGRLAAQLRPGAIFLLHDAIWDGLEPGVEDRGPLLEAVDRFLAEAAPHTRFVTVPELLALGRPVKVNWYRT